MSAPADRYRTPSQAAPVWPGPPALGESPALRRLNRASYSWLDGRSSVYRTTFSLLLHITLVLGVIRTAPLWVGPPAGFGGRGDYRLGLTDGNEIDGTSTIIAAPAAGAPALAGGPASDQSGAPAETTTTAGTGDTVVSPLAETDAPPLALPQVGGGTVPGSITAGEQTGTGTGTQTDLTQMVRSNGVRGAGGTADGIASGNGPQGTSFMGLEDQGARVVFLIDCSGSMTNYNAMRVAKSALISSIQQLHPAQQFQIVFYNDQVRLLTIGRGGDQLIPATDINKTQARQYIGGIVPDLGTRHSPAIERALALTPDIVFLLTDADEPQLEPRQLADIVQRNEGRTRIHAIEFGRGPELNLDNWLKRISQQNGGSYRYVDVAREDRRSVGALAP